MDAIKQKIYLREHMSVNRLNEDDRDDEDDLLAKIGFPVDDHGDSEFVTMITDDFEKMVENYINDTLRKYVKEGTKDWDVLKGIVLDSITSYIYFNPDLRQYLY